ncbi:MAG: element excision factor XisH family protein [Anaerolineae bacterium]|nr:element excision factor XisH family protein [Anaerolineae bacterium]
MARDIFHDLVKNALIRAGWTITHDPLVIRWGRRDLFVDLGASQLLAATQGDQKIAVEIKSFLNKSAVTDFYAALGQFGVYREIMAEQEKDRVLYLAIPFDVYTDLFEDDLGRLIISRQRLKLILFNPETEEIVKWIN